jgi:hypothetical protein
MLTITGLNESPFSIFGRVKLPKKKGFISDSLNLEDRTDSPETSVSNRLTPLNNPEEGRIQLNRGGSL